MDPQALGILPDFYLFFLCQKTTIRVYLLDMSRGLLNNESRAIG